MEIRHEITIPRDIWFFIDGKVETPWVFSALCGGKTFRFTFSEKPCSGDIAFALESMREMFLIKFQIDPRLN